MKNVFFKASLMAAAVILAAVSCTKEVPQGEDVKDELHTCQMRLVGSKAEYDQPQTKAGGSSSWADGSTIYLRMNSPMGTTLGTAVYKASTDVWTVSYYGSLYEDVANTCSAVYAEDFEKVENNVITLNENSVIYEDQAGSYLYSGGDLVVTANLKPKTGRLRFNGASGKVVKVYGITHYTTYDQNTNLYTTTAADFKTTVAANGYTPYLYGYFTEAEEPSIKVWIDAKEAYTRYLSTELFKAGESGKLTVPTETAHSGWSDGLIFNVGGEKFKMIAVEGGSFTMGNPNSTNEYFTAHSVTLTGYCIQETEYYNKLAGKVIGSSSYTSLKPFANAYRSTYLSHISKLNSKTNTVFSFPTEAQWEFAARGGTKSNGYKYSGSDNIDDVAWYASNSGNAAHDIKTKLPNELGIYDLTGNVSEDVLDYYAPFSSNSLINPVVTSGDYFVVRGGNYGLDNGIYVYYRADRSSSYSAQIGFRLALNW